MKNLLKKISVLFVALLMFATNGTIAYADVDRPTDSATLTIGGLEGGETVDLYQIMTATYTANGKNVSYNLDSKLYEADTTVVLKDAVLYTQADYDAYVTENSEEPEWSVGDVKEPKVTTTVKDLPVGDNGKLKDGTVTVDGIDYPVTANAVKVEKSGQQSTEDLTGKFPFSTSAPTEKQISAISADIAKNPTTWAGNKKAVDGTVTVDATNKKWEVTAYAKAAADKDAGDDSPAIYDATGIYLGRVTPAEGTDTVYNPVIVSVGYKTENNVISFDANGISNMNNAKYDAPSVAMKKSTPNVDKTVTGGKNEDFAPLVVAVGLDGTPIDAQGNSLYVGQPTIDPDNFYYVKKQSDPNLTAADVQNLIKTALEAEPKLPIADYVTDNKEEAFTGTSATQLTGALGTKFTYELQPTLPSYPENAVNKTLWFSDAMSKGLDYVYGSLEVKLDKSHAVVTKTYDSTTKKYVFNVQPYSKKEVTVGDDVTGLYEYANGAWAVTEDTEAQTGKEYFEQGAVTKLADAIDNEDGFNINFVYDAIPEADRVKGGLIMNYQAVINKNAIKGIEGNPNVVRMIYTNQPDKGNTHKTTDKPSDEGNKEKFDKEVVYTYEIYFKKVDDKGEVLKNAVFGLYAKEDIKYSDAANTVLYKTDELVCTIETNNDGIGYTTEVVPGKYYLKEIKQPDGYQLNTNTYDVTVSAANATKEVTVTTHSSWEYTSDITKAMDYEAPVAPATEGTATQAGWLVNGNFYELVDYPTSAWTYTAPNTTGEKGTLTNATTGQVINDVLPAYVSAEHHVRTENVTVNDHANDDPLNRGWVFVAEIPNTKTPGLPSTGGIGTYMFTIAGVAILATAAFMLIFRKKEENV